MGIHLNKIEYLFLYVFACFCMFLCITVLPLLLYATLTKQEKRKLKMIRYPLTNRDAMRTIMNQIPAALVRFSDPVVQEFFEDERLGLCTVIVKRIPPIATGDDVQHHILVQYNDADLHMIKMLSV